MASTPDTTSGPREDADGADLARRIAELDTTLFDHIPAQLEPDDRRSLLALHAGCSAAYGTFAYLEIGSHLGGSLQVMVRDRACEAIISIDSRPSWQADARGYQFGYPDNSTARMLETLAEVPQAVTGKLTTYDATTAQLDPADLPRAPKLCLIDGEHTDAAALADARFCRAAVRDSGCIVFHDAAVVYRGISQFLEELSGVEHTAYFLPSVVFVVELGPTRLRDTPQVASMLRANYRGYLFSLQSNDLYRQFYNHSAFRAVRRLKTLVRRSDFVR